MNDLHLNRIEKEAEARNRLGMGMMLGSDAVLSLCRRARAVEQSEAWQQGYQVGIAKGQKDPAVHERAYAAGFREGQQTSEVLLIHRQMAGLQQMLDAERLRASSAVAVSNAIQDKLCERPRALVTNGDYMAGYRDGFRNGSDEASKGERDDIAEMVAAEEAKPGGKAAMDAARAWVAQHSGSNEPCQHRGTCNAHNCICAQIQNGKQEVMHECRHCGWMCAPNASPSKKGYPLSAASQPRDHMEGTVGDAPFPSHWHALLEWNRRQSEPPIKIGREYDVAKAFAALMAPPAGEAGRESDDYDCHRCYDELIARGVTPMPRMILCANCGNKRCPHAHDHRNACSGSNEPGQPGSAYPAVSAKGGKE